MKQYLLLSFLLCPTIVLADGMDMPSAPTVQEPEVEPVELDKRLPPYMPGQKVNLGGHKMRAWSTSGPVPVSPTPPKAPEVPKSPEEYGSNKDISVIVDRRGDKVDESQ